MTRSDLYPLAWGAAQLYLFGKLLPLTQMVVKSRAINTGNSISLLALGLASVALFLLFSNVMLILGSMKESTHAQSGAWLQQVGIQTVGLMVMVFALSFLASF